MRIVTDHAARLTGAGFTTSQAAAIDAAVHATASEAVEALEGQLARWHAYLAGYLLIEIGIVLLAILIIQAVREPAYSSRPRLATRPEGPMVAVRPGDSW
ncbi:hypothetical protein GOFOIKOB_5180 [Methylobacterium tardum]|uniref:Uncharacterized protein n=1 Tax=Methylobacterium tardum TaxID=374432 RepID=A0AA37WUY4_9HYPH|nr:hypothetical protein [Methylobacterium tardum]URD38096.1 hypothetical protein M6G65_06360 [Methylobacterium tardum]GJE52112.1 hypothetical protein GOFOIKOB_5180 [Methylobacterium tardum]GLS71668.1 hypothetical protein GCM10007890_36810 [Methylobacterium tardum]